MSRESLIAVIRAHLKKSGLSLTSGGLRIAGRLEDDAIRDIVELVQELTPEAPTTGRTKTVEITPEKQADLLKEMQ